MAFRNKTKARALVIAALSILPALSAEPGDYVVRHRHFRRGSFGTLHIDGAGLSFAEHGPKTSHSRQWRYEDIQQLVISPSTLSILTYEDIGWQLGRDREFVFDDLPKQFVEQIYPLLRNRLDQRFVAALADDQIKPVWRVPAKLLHGRRGSQGVVLVGTDRIVYETDKADESRTWRISDIQNISTAGPFDLTITTYERSAFNYGDRKEFRFQLKNPLDEARYNQLWQSVNEANGLQILTSRSNQE